MLKEYIGFLKKYLKLVKIHKISFIFTIVSLIIYRGAIIAIPIFASWIIKYLTDYNQSMVYISLGLLGVMYLVKYLSYFVKKKFYEMGFKHYYRYLQNKLFNRLLNIDDRFNEKINKGKLFESVNSSIIHLSSFMDNITNSLTVIIQIAITIGIVYYNDITLGVIFIIYSVIIILLKNNFDRKVEIYLEKETNVADKYSSIFMQLLNGLQEIKVFNIINKINSKLNRILNKYSKIYIIRRNYHTLRDCDTLAVTFIFRIIILVILLLQLQKELISIEFVVLIYSYHKMVANYIKNMITYTSTIRSKQIDLKRVNDILNYKLIRNINFGNINKDVIDGLVEFKNVKFKYKNTYILNDFNLKIYPNEITTIVGRSGSGKTSIINLLLRLYKIDKGSINIDGINIYDYSKESYNKDVTVVSQHTFIFNTSIRNNLSFVDKDKKRQIEVCKIVGLHSYISKLPNGYNTKMKYSKMTSGQKQLLSIARALLSNSEILIFDEITSSLDKETIIKVSKLLDKLKENHTIIMITHKVKLMEKADRIVFINKGDIVEDNTFNYLLDNNEEFNKFIHSNKSASKIGVFN